MDQTPLLFSNLFFFAFVIYLLLGLHIIQLNRKAALNRVFFAMCVSLCFWALGFSVANSAPSYEICFFWRRVSAIGWGSIYGIMLHFFLLLTGNSLCTRKRWLVCALLYLPAVICIFVFGISKDLAATQYHLIRMDYGWVNSSVPGIWETFFRVYYVGYVLASMGVIWRWRHKTTERKVRQQADMLFLSIFAALLLGTITDVVLSATLKGPLPQMAPIITLIPIAVWFYSVRRYKLMRNPVENDGELSFQEKTRTKMEYYLGFSFLIGGVVGSIAYFLPHMVNSDVSMKSILWSSGTLFIIGLISLLAQLIKNENVKELILLTIMLCSIPIVTLQFIQFASITIWVFPIILMIGSLIFWNLRVLTLITLVSIATQLFVWFNAPQGPVAMDEFDYFIRIVVFITAFIVGSFINKTYNRRLEENIYQANFQKLISEISFDFVSISQENLAKKANNMLEKMGCFFQVDRTYIFLINQQRGTMTYSHEWCNEGITPETTIIQDVPLTVFPWWMEQLNANKLVYIEDVNQLPEQASIEKEQLTQQGVKSLVAIPVEENGTTLGFMGLDSVTTTKKWSKYHIELLRILSNLLADGLIKIKSEQAIEYMAYYDHLTGLPNRTLFSDRLTQAIHLAKRNEKFVGVMFLDLDEFKTINDTLGHSVGDVLLKGIAQSLAQRIRQTDTVARFGGDEFLILVNNLSNDKYMDKIAENIMEVFTHPFSINDREFYVTGSAGVAVYPFDGEDVETLVKNADVAMYSAKTKGKNQYVLCTTNIKEEIRNNIKLSNYLYRVQERGELAVYYQPQIRLNTGKIVGLEALLRWKHPEMGMIPPSLFVPLAERNGTINSIGEWVLRTAIYQNKKWQESGYPPVRVAVNLSIVQFNDPNFVDKVGQIVEEAGLDPQYLELEVTESIATKEAIHVVDALDRLKQLGISISIDDFGTGYSSLNRLKSLPIDRIKIDMQFIQGIRGSEKDQAITKAIINLAKNLRLEVLAEGVEVAPHLDFLNQNMCDEVQGYYFYEPMPAEEIEKLFYGYKLGLKN